MIWNSKLQPSNAGSPSQKSNNTLGKGGSCQPLIYDGVGWKRIIVVVSRKHKSPPPTPIHMVRDVLGIWAHSYCFPLVFCLMVQELLAQRRSKRMHRLRPQFANLLCDSAGPTSDCTASISESLCLCTRLSTHGSFSPRQMEYLGCASKSALLGPFPNDIVG